MTVTERFLKYVTFETTSDESSDSVPSTATQLVLADYLVEELRGAGVADAMRDEMGYVYGHIPASDGCENCPKIGLVSHMDTSPDVSGANVKPQIIKFDGTNAPMVGDEYIGRELIVTDHTTLLGADDKAGVEPEIVPIRGGTDGARLSFEGLPCPNLSTGGMNFHSIYEAIPVDALPKMVEVLINIVSVTD